MKSRYLITSALLCVALTGCGQQVTEPQSEPPVKVTGPKERPTPAPDSADAEPIKRSDQQRQKRADP
jgi:hypothetical protein